MNTNLSLPAGHYLNLQVAPRWPYNKIVICRDAFSRLQQAQEKLDPSVQLVITRGFEPGNWIVRRLHLLMRRIGSIVFLLLYPGRAEEIPAIFSANGHDTDGTHVDIAIKLNGKLLNLLPMGVLTPASHLAATETEYSSILAGVRNTLSSLGFKTHTNQTEALQIHCDLIA